ncbi:hypothetical protein LZ31DRAFT_160515 [Colletotrichum somersetense]|nr:hypothetical protein LZ31DRAFT_160515 [Colletotrichum somersetense]
MKGPGFLLFFIFRLTTLIKTTPHSESCDTHSECARAISSFSLSLDTLPPPPPPLSHGFGLSATLAWGRKKRRMGKLNGCTGLLGHSTRVPGASVRVEWGESLHVCASHLRSGTSQPCPRG